MSTTAAFPNLTNTLLHVLSALGLYWLVLTMFSDDRLAFLSAGLFVVHPVHTEAVTYISGRADPLALMFLMLTFIFYLKGPSTKSPGTHAAMAVCYALALLSKESALILPALILVHAGLMHERIRTGKIVSLVGLTLVYLLLRVTVLKDMRHLLTPVL